MNNRRNPQNLVRPTFPGESRSEFVHRGLASVYETQVLGNGICADEVLAQLDAKLLTARKTLAQRKA